MIKELGRRGAIQRERQPTQRDNWKRSMIKMSSLKTYSDSCSILMMKAIYLIFTSKKMTNNIYPPFNQIRYQCYNNYE